MTGVGALTGQTPATNPQLTDLSNSGTNTDANGNGRANEADENRPAPVAPACVPGTTVVESADKSAISNPVQRGDQMEKPARTASTDSVDLFPCKVMRPRSITQT